MELTLPYAVALKLGCVLEARGGILKVLTSVPHPRDAGLIGLGWA